MPPRIQKRAASETIPVSRGISSRGYWVLKAEIGAAAEAELKRDLTMTPKATGGVGGGTKQQDGVEFPLWLESASKLYLPKYYGLRRYGVLPPASVKLDPGTPLDPGVAFACHLREEQRVPIAAFLEAARDPARMGGILSLPCGFGKTVMALHLIAELGVRTIVVVHKDFLLNQWRDRISEFLPAARIGLVKAKTIDVEGKDIVIASLQSLSMKEYGADLFKGIGFLIVDEVHRVGTEVFSRALHKTTFRYSLGISATVQRKDGMTKAFVHFLGDVLFKGKRREDDVLVVQKGYWDEAPAYRREETIGYGPRASPNVSRMINNLTAHAPRTRAIVDAISRAVTAQPGRRVLVLSDRKAQLTDLREGVEAAGLTAGFYWGGMKRPALAESETKQVMLATFSYAAEGMDVPGLDTLVLASPKSDIEQSVGRILRLKADARERRPMVIDFVDQFSLFERQGAKRRAFYRTFKYRVFDDLEDALLVADPAATSARTEATSDEDDDAESPSANANACAFVLDDDEDNDKLVVSVPRPAWTNHPNHPKI